jgi:transcriptional regulator with XRE-family HTH domain
MTHTVQQRTLLRIREEMLHQKRSQEALSELVKWSPSRLSKVLNGVIELTVNDLEALCGALRLQPTEAVRDRGLEFCAQMTPTELRVIEGYRELDAEGVAAVHYIIGKRTDEKRGATPRKPLFGKARPR